MRFHLFTPRPAAAALLLGGLLVAEARAGSETVALKPFNGQSTVTSQTATRYVVLRRPYLQLVGPTGLRFAEADEPLVRQPPKMPAVRKAPPFDADAFNAAQPSPTPFKITTQPEVPQQSSASVLNGDNASTVLPPLPAPTATPAAAPAAPLPNSLTPSAGDPNDLSDAMLYFDAPAAPNAPGSRNSQGGHVELVAPLNLQPPAGAPQPPSSATYEVH